MYRIAAIQMDTGMPIHLPEPRYKYPLGRSNSVLPLVVPSCTPRSRISIARVTMKALSRSRTIRKPLIAPTTAPVNSTTGIASHHASPTPEPPTSTFLMISHAPSIGASPTTDSSDKSNFPASRIKVSAITTTESSEDCCRMLRKLSLVRKASEANAPMTITSTITGISVSSRNPSSAPRCRGTAGRSCTASTRWLAMSDPLDRRDQFFAAPAGGKFLRQPALEDDEHAVADGQLVQLVGHNQHCGAAGARARRSRTAPPLRRCRPLASDTAAPA